MNCEDRIECLKIEYPKIPYHNLPKLWDEKCRLVIRGALNVMSSKSINYFCILKH